MTNPIMSSNCGVTYSALRCKTQRYIDEIAKRLFVAGGKMCRKYSITYNKCTQMIAMLKKVNW